MRNRLKDRERASVLGFVARLAGLLVLLSLALGLAGWLLWHYGIAGLVAGLIVLAVALAGLPALPILGPPD